MVILDLQSRARHRAHRAEVAHRDGGVAPIGRHGRQARRLPIRTRSPSSRRAPLGGHPSARERLCSTLHKAVDASTANQSPDFRDNRPSTAVAVVGSATPDRQRDQLLARHRRRLRAHDQVSAVRRRSMFPVRPSVHSSTRSPLSSRSAARPERDRPRQPEGSSSGVQCGRRCRGRRAERRPASAAGGLTARVGRQPVECSCPHQICA